jgi:EAL domain-containing protein (putative c-di-GMP-specific phosphodiesterase class I)
MRRPYARPSASRQIALLSQIRTALERRDLILLYQPKAELASGRIVGAEALVRWRHPERGLLGPEEFVPLVERTWLVGPVTLYILERALEQIAHWRDLGLKLTGAVNLAPRNLLDSRLPEQLGTLLLRHRTRPGELVVEVSESATLADPQRAYEVLERLRAMGVGVAIDDFGASHASLAHLVRLPADELKVDRPFVAALCESPCAEAVVRTTVDLAGRLGLSVVAEGIETPDAWQRLAAIGCDTGQGYLISRPLAPSELTAWLLSDAPTPGAPAGPRAPRARL